MMKFGEIILSLAKEILTLILARMNESRSDSVLGSKCVEIHPNPVYLH